MGWKGSSGSEPALQPRVEQYRSSFWYHSARGQWVTSWHTLNEMRSGLQVFRVQSATTTTVLAPGLPTHNYTQLEGSRGRRGPSKAPNNANAQQRRFVHGLPGQSGAPLTANQSCARGGAFQRRTNQVRRSETPCIHSISRILVETGGAIISPSIQCFNCASFLVIWSIIVKVDLIEYT